MFHCRLVTPERTLLDEQVSLVSLPTAGGQITVLDHHIPLTSVLVPGVLRIKTAQAQEQEVAVSNGFIHILPGGAVTVLANTAERGEELDLSTIAEAKKRAEEVMRQVINRNDVSYAMAAAGLERELARERVAIRHRARRGHAPDPLAS